VVRACQSTPIDFFVCVVITSIHCNRGASSTHRPVAKGKTKRNSRTAHKTDTAIHYGDEGRDAGVGEEKGGMGDYSLLAAASSLVACTAAGLLRAAALPPPPTPSAAAADASIRPAGHGADRSVRAPPAARTGRWIGGVWGREEDESTNTETGRRNAGRKGEPMRPGPMLSVTIIQIQKMRATMQR
jgi:hypothetical protein